VLNALSGDQKLQGYRFAGNLIKFKAASFRFSTLIKSNPLISLSNLLRTEPGSLLGFLSHSCRARGCAMAGIYRRLGPGGVIYITQVENRPGGLRASFPDAKVPQGRKEDSPGQVRSADAILAKRLNVSQAREGRRKPWNKAILGVGCGYATALLRCSRFSLSSRSSTNCNR